MKKLTLKKETMKKLTQASLEIPKGGVTSLVSNGLFNCMTFKPCYQLP
jgi:hypothetical protein